MKRYLLIVVFLLGLLYVAWPVPSFDSFVSFPKGNHLESSKGGITYFTDSGRKEITEFYLKEFGRANCDLFEDTNPFCYIKPLKLNHPPEQAVNFFPPKSDTLPVNSTYLEEYYYPLRGSIVVSGYEPYDEAGKAFNKYSTPLTVDGKTYFSQIMVRYDGTAGGGRVAVYVLVWLSGWGIVRVFNKLRH